MLKMIAATMDDLNRIEELYKKCTLNLIKKGLFQWDNNYPNINTYINAINDKTQYIFEDDNELIGSAILNEYQSEDWSLVNWNYNDGKILVLHALAINPSIQGKGYGQKVLKHCESYGLEKGYMFMRLDVFSENQVAIRLYEKNEYKKAGEAIFDFKPKEHQKYLCYEKKLK